jgi:hypothetical protein
MFLQRYTTLNVCVNNKSWTHRPKTQRGRRGGRRVRQEGRRRGFLKRPLNFVADGLQNEIRYQSFSIISELLLLLELFAASSPLSSVSFMNKQSYGKVKRDLLHSQKRPITKPKVCVSFMNKQADASTIFPRAIRLKARYSN